MQITATMYSELCSMHLDRPIYFLLNLMQCCVEFESVTTEELKLAQYYILVIVFTCHVIAYSIYFILDTDLLCLIDY